MPCFRRFVVSSPLFSGYEIFLDIDNYPTMDSIINEFYNNLYSLLEQYKFEVLLEELKKTQFHIHDITMTDIESFNSEKIIYICDHC
jgi:hypothetical protein